ncbi:MAG: energy-coupling factor ABC transporter ATP-binding protein [Phycisphaerae bacterium]|nr:energy-coupling factor ABC transporter ATP-binding protein [Phycisphaerae bacterium]
MTAIDIKDFSFHYPDGTPALNRVSLSIEPGEKVLLIGPNGAGKSSLLLAMAGFAQGTGSVVVEGLKVTKKNLKAIRQVLGCCLENPDDQLFMPTLFEDIAFGPLNMGLSQAEIEQRVTQALTTVGLADKAHKPPHHLSAGQKRAAAIATVLSMAPRIITLDEPDGSLDPRRRIELQTLLKSLTQTLVIATCNMNFAYALADRVILVDHGQIVADGTAQTIMTDRALMETHGLELPAL